MFKKIAMVLFHPHTFFTTYTQQTIGESTGYFVMLSVWYSILLVATQNVFSGTALGAKLSVFTTASSIILIPLLIIIHLCAVFIAASLYHLAALIAKGQHDYAQTFSVVVYSSTPLLLLGWIPHFGVLIPLLLYDLYLFVVGTSLFHKMSKARALLVYFMPLLFIGALIILIGLLAFTILKVKFPDF